MTMESSIERQLIREPLSDELRIWHIRGATATTTDSLLLSAFLPMGEEAALELGAGGGIVSLLSARRGRFSSCVLVERQRELAELAERNIRENRLDGCLSVIRGDLRELRGEACYHTVFANPPYRRAGEGRPASDPLADAARFERAGGITDFCEAASRLMMIGGSFSMVFPYARLAEAETAIEGAGLFPEEIVRIFPYRGKEPKLFLLRARKTPSTVSLRTFYLAEEKGGPPSHEAELLYREGILLTQGEQP